MGAKMGALMQSKPWKSMLGLLVVACVSFSLPLLLVRQPLGWAAVEWLSLVALYLLGVRVFGRRSAIEIGVVIFAIAWFLAILVFALEAANKHRKHPIGSSVDVGLTIDGGGSKTKYRAYEGNTSRIVEGFSCVWIKGRGKL